MSKPWAWCSLCDYAANDPTDHLKHIHRVHDGLMLPDDWYAPRSSRHINAQWDDKTAVVVDINLDPSCPPDVKVRYVGSHAARVKPGYERHYIRSDAELGRFEREHNVVSHIRHYDSNGRAMDDTFRGESYN